MDTVQVHTNNFPRDILYTYELDLYGYDIAKLREDYNWIDSEDWDTTEWFIYKGELYCLSDFQGVHNQFWNSNPPEWMKPWDGYTSFGFIGGLLIKYPRMDYDPNELDTEHVIVGWY